MAHPPRPRIPPKTRVRIYSQLGYVRHVCPVTGQIAVVLDGEDGRFDYYSPCQVEVAP